MSTDIRQQIRELAELQQSSRRPVELHEVQGFSTGASTPIPRRNLRGPALAVAVMAAVLVVIGGLALLVSSGEETPPADSVTPTTLVVPTTASPTPSTTATADLAPGTADLTWQRIDMDQIPEPLNAPLGATIFDGGDKFVAFIAGDASTEVLISADGTNWRSVPTEEALGDAQTAAAWEDEVLVATGGGGWSWEEDGPFFSSPSIVSVVHSDGSVDRRVFDGDVRSAALGPAGMFVTLAPHASYGYVIDQILGSEFSGAVYETEVRDGVLVVTRAPDGETAEIVLSEHGLTEDELNSPVAGWYSAAGSDWLPVPDLPSGLRVVATRDGFVGVSESTAWHSVDGLEWNRLGDLPFAPEPWQFSQLPMRWRQGVVATDLSHYAYISSEGVELLPDPPVALSSADGAPFPLFLAGDLGIVLVNPVERELLFTQDGENWKAGTLPDDMTDSFGWYTSSGAVTGEAVLLLLWEEETPGGVQRPAWWLGTPSEE